MNFTSNFVGINAYGPLVAGELSGEDENIDIEGEVRNIRICWQLSTSTKILKRESVSKKKEITFLTVGAVLAGGSVYLFIFLVLSVTNPKPPRMMSSSPNYKPFLSSFRHIPLRKVLYRI